MIITLTEVQVCMIRIALRDKAERTPFTLPDEPPGKRDYYNLASQLDRFVRMEISHVT